MTFTGTVQSNRKKMLAEVKGKKKMKKGEINGYRLEDMIALEWMDKRKVLMLSTRLFSIETVDIPPR